LTVTTENDDHNDNTVLDKASIERDITRGAKAARDLRDKAGKTWQNWSAVIVGLRGFHALACERAGTNNMQAQNYRDAMSGLLESKRGVEYSWIDKQTRSDCYRLMECISEVDVWYAGLDTNQKSRWNHPTTIVKHCPKQYLKGGMRKHNKPPKKDKKKPTVTFETERLKALLIEVITRLAKYEPDAMTLLKQIYPTDPDDNIDDLAAE
jgi:hypothetical protein